MDDWPVEFSWDVLDKDGNSLATRRIGQRCLLTKEQIRDTPSGSMHRVALLDVSVAVRQRSFYVV